MKASALTVAAVSFVAPQFCAATFTVANTASAGPGTFDEAICYADWIVFDLPYPATSRSGGAK